MNILLLVASLASAQTPLPVESFDKEGAPQALQVELDQRFSVSGGTVTGWIIISTTTAGIQFGDGTYLTSTGSIKSSSSGDTAWTTQQVFSATGQFTVPSTVTVYMVEVWGGGGAGGAGSGGGSGGYGGGGGGYCRGIVVSTSGAVYTATVGAAGGTSRYADLLTATGGATGAAGGSGTASAAGGTCSLGVVAMAGGAGHVQNDGVNLGGPGGDSPNGGAGGVGGKASGSGGTGVTPGGGGGGGGGSAAGNGGTGAPGLVVITY